MHSVIYKDWLNYFILGLKNVNKVRIISPFITNNLVRHLLEKRGSAQIEVVTRYNLNDFRNKVSSITALKNLVNAGVNVKGIKDLHSKVYIFDSVSVIVASANFTSGGFFNNHEFGIRSVSETVVNDSIKYFYSLFTLDQDSLTLSTLEEWEQQLKKNEPEMPTGPVLPDFGVSTLTGRLSNKRFFIKFFGSGENRAGLSYSCRQMVKDSHCHFALTFSGKRGRPRKYRTGDVVFLARILNGKDYAIFGKAIAMQHNDTRDVASDEDIAQFSWKADWPIYIRIKDPIFLDGNMGDCPKMSRLIKELDVESFAWTNRRTLNGEAEINPWDSLRRQADVELTEIGAEWLLGKFDNALQKKGVIPDSFIRSLYQSIVPE